MPSDETLRRIREVWEIETRGRLGSFEAWGAEELDVLARRSYDAGYQAGIEAAEKHLRQCSRFAAASRDKARTAGQHTLADLLDFRADTLAEVSLDALKAVDRG
jgi:hypothetical protein